MNYVHSLSSVTIICFDKNIDLIKKRKKKRKHIKNKQVYNVLQLLVTELLKDCISALVPNMM